MSKMEQGMSRRNFLVGAGAVSALGALGLAGCSPKKSASDEKAASGEAGSATGGSNDWLGEAPEIAASDIKETRETDILIVGAGMSGSAAIATAIDEGANFIAVDKGTEPAACHFDIGAINSKWTAEAGEHVDEGRLLNEMNRYASFKNIAAVTNTWIKNSGAMVEWLYVFYAKHGVETKVELDIENGSDGKAGGTNYYIPAECHHFMTADGKRVDHVKVIAQIAEESGNPVQYGFDMVKLIREDGGRVSGAIFKTADGYVQINAAKAVILACGGYAGNAEMVKARNPIVPACVTSTNFNQNNTGMGMKAAAWVGAALDIEGAAMIFDRGIVEPGVDAGYADESTASFATGGQFNLGSQPFLKVDRNGHRITNESANYDAICHAASTRPGGVWCQVFDVNAPEDVQRFKTQGCSAMTWKQTLKGKTVDETYDEKYISKGLMMKADTLDELADKLGFEGEAKEAFLAEIDNYNAMYDAGEDTQFGKEAYRLSAIRTAPFYGAWYGGSLLTTLDGIRINENTQVLDTKGNVIDGLYAVGTASGSFYAGNYPVYIVGDCLGRQMTFGHYSVRHAEGVIA